MTEEKILVEAKIRTIAQTSMVEGMIEVRLLQRMSESQ